MCHVLFFTLENVCMCNCKNPILKQKLKWKHKLCHHLHCIFFWCALEFHDGKSETPKPHIGNKSPKHKKNESLIHTKSNSNNMWSFEHHVYG